MTQAPADLRYSSSHEWAYLEGQVITIGITQFAQNQLGDVVFVELPEVGAELTAGDAVAVVESVKAASDIYAPVSGKVIAVNESLQDNPELINSDPYEDGWFFKIEITDSSGFDAMMDADSYLDHCADA
jgi:glycine cleavage system H protein